MTPGQIEARSSDRYLRRNVEAARTIGVAVEGGIAKETDGVESVAQSASAVNGLRSFGPQRAIR